MSARVVVTGGRDYADRARVFAELDALFPDIVAHGGCGKRTVSDPGALRGADRWAQEWAEANAAECWVYYADFRMGKAQGPIRNRRMLTDFKPDVVLAFPGGKGTADCIKAARERGIRVIEVTP